LIVDFEQLLSRIGLALGIGLLIGLERGWRRRDANPGARAAGIRTFAISGILGGLCGAIAGSLGDATAGAVVLAAGIAAHAAVFVLFSLEENRALGSHSATTAIAGVLTFVLGAYSLLGDERIAAAAAVATAAILALREELHDWVAKITWSELQSGLVLLAMTFIALPVLPAGPVGPFGGVSPREVWIIAIVLAGVSFVGYVAVRYLGADRGVLLASAAGGLVSSTAVTLANARRAAAGEGSPQLLAAGVAVATAISLLRVLAIVAFVNSSLLVLLAAPLGVAAAAVIGYAILSLQRQQPNDPAAPPAFRNPFGFWSVIGSAALLAAIILLGRAAGERFGAAGAIGGAALVGLADVDAVSISMARLAPEPLAPESAAYAVLAAVASNTLCKAAIAALIGRGGFAVNMAALSAFALLAAGLGLLVTLMLRAS
jgi:uncharacterized membrane protein (DUF4010 family)